MQKDGALKSIQEYSERSPYFAEFFRLYTRMRSPVNNKIPQVIMVTSAVAGEGKTTVSAYLGITAALATQKNHLIIDADLNRPSLHKKLGLEQVNGLTEMLTDGLELAQAIQPTSFASLQVISSGRMVPNPFELLSVSRLDSLFTQLRQYYETIIMDAPPVLNVSDTLKLAQYVDGIIMVVLSGSTNREVVKRATENLREINVPILGVILNDMGEVLPYYYQQKYYASHYQSAAQD